MKIAIVTNLNGLGLQVEAHLLRGFLEELEHDVDVFQYDAPLPELTTLYKLAIYLEVIPQDKLILAETRWAFLNPEWLKPDVLQLARRHMNKIFGKTLEAERIFKELLPDNEVHYTGFLARDRFVEDVARRSKFLHIGGNSSLRGTQTLVDALKWRHESEEPLPAEVVIVSTALQDRPEIPGVTYYERMSDDEILWLQNECKFHIYPSGTEGFGHAIHEAMSCDAVILTVDAPPMNEVENAYYMGTCSTTTYNYATVYEVSAVELQGHMRNLLYLEARGIQFMKPREAFLLGNQEFKKRILDHLTKIDTPKVAMAVPNAPRTKRKDQLGIVFLGNFDASESTENMIKWALVDNGVEVTSIQENLLTDVRALKIIAQGMDAFLWVRTAGWLQISDREMFDFFDWLRAHEIPSISLHLDKFWGIPERERLIGQIPFWKTDHVWTADGGFYEQFRERGVNHHWLIPAVSKVYCHPGWPSGAYTCDVGFVGARSYHAEYPFRADLLRFLEEAYRGRFRHIEGGLRGHGLNDFYASCKVAVGDCIFAGTPFYWSDRLPETCGRRGFIVHPEVPGGLAPATATYKAQDLRDLEKQIDFYLAREKQRQEIRDHCYDEVIKSHTWSSRMKEVLERSLDGKQI